MLRYYIWTIGCQMNRAESRRIAGYLQAAGYQPATHFSDADLIVLNTCVVRQSAEDRVLGTLGLLKGLKNRRSDIRVLVTGCFVGCDDDLTGRYPEVDYSFRPGDYDGFLAWGKRQGISLEKATLPEAGSPCAFVPIIQGCDNFCSYCVVPYRRGREVSRPVDDIVCEVRGMARKGTREVTLLGQNVDSYGHDLPGQPDLADLLVELNSIDELARIRFLTNHPKDISLKLIDTVACSDKVCEHLHLPAQSGDNDILEAMRRGYSVDQYIGLVDTIRRNIHQVSLSTDIIVGFAGETEEQFGHTYSLVESLRFDVVHVAAYSPRPDTMASREYRDDVPQPIKKERFARIEALQAGIASGINALLRGTLVEVLVEGQRKGKWFGRTRSDKLVFFEATGDRAGRLADIMIGRTSPWSLGGEVSDK
ncbi:MAG: MiaB/RimO family radical SAM methylthiotransferase [Dehalococcoidia bacterium]